MTNDPRSQLEARLLEIRRESRAVLRTSNDVLEISTAMGNLTGVDVALNIVSTTDLSDAARRKLVEHSLSRARAETEVLETTLKALTNV